MRRLCQSWAGCINHVKRHLFGGSVKPRSLARCVSLFFGTPYRMGDAAADTGQHRPPNAHPSGSAMEAWDGSVHQASVPLGQCIAIHRLALA